MSEIRWNFLRYQAAEDVRDPYGNELFASEKQAASLVRESTQNSLDASTGGPTRLVLTLGQADPTEADRYLKSLRPHLATQESIASRLPEPSEPVPYLNVEDFGTRGLTGTYNLTAFDEGDEQRFLGFLRYEGLSMKTTGNRGSWGIGKTVFPAASMANSLFALTHRVTDRKTLLVGRAQLKSHADPNGSNGHLQPYGKFAKYSNESGEVIPQAIDDPDVLEHFAATFNLDRADEPGLSVVVPYPGNDAADFDELARAVVEHCFAPVLQRQLAVVVRSGDRELVLDDSTLLDSLDVIKKWSQSEKSDLRKRLEFANWALSTREADITRLSAPSDHAIARDMFGDGLERYAERFLAEERLAFRVPVEIRPVGGEPVWSHFDVFIVRDFELRKPDDHYIRRGVLASELSGSVPSGVRAITLVEDEALAELLRLSEDVPHTKWRQRNIQRVTEKYVAPTHVIGLACRAAKEIANILLTADERPDDQMLAPFFPEAEEGRSRGQGGGANQGGRQGTEADEGDETNTPGPPDGLGLPAFRYGQVDTGFQLRGEPGSQRPLRPIRVRVAYATFSGNALSKYREDDFTLDDDGDMTVDGAGIEIRWRRGNAIEFVPVRRDFLLEVKGFDSRRAIRVVPAVLIEDEDDGDTVSDRPTED